MIKDYGFFHDYPYTNFHEMNLDWLLAQMLELRSDMKNFVNQNTIKYADPIQWNITTQYEGNTVVIDAASGNAYISTQPVPAGVAITNTDYWSLVGNFSEMYGTIKDSITKNDQGSSIAASKNYNLGEWLWLDEKLYTCLNDIGYGDTLVTTGISANLKEININEYNKNLYNYDNTSMTVKADITGEATTPAEIDKIKCGDLDIAIKDSIARGNITNINETIAEIEEQITSQELFKTPQMYGAVGDGVTDDSQAFNDLFTNNKNIFIPAGNYLISSRIFVYEGSVVIGSGSSKIHTSLNDTSVFKTMGSDITFINLTVEGNKGTGATGTPYNHGWYLSDPKNTSLYKCVAMNMFGDGFYIGCDHPQDGQPYNTNLHGCLADNCGRNGFSIISNSSFHLTDCEARNTSGNNPQMAIDIEPNSDDSVLIGTITNFKSSGNHNGALQLYLGYTANPIEIQITNFTSIGDSNNTDGRNIFQLFNNVASNRGEIILDNIIVRSGYQNALYLSGFKSQLCAKITNFIVDTHLGTNVVQLSAPEAMGSQGDYDIDLTLRNRGSVTTTLITTSGNGSLSNVNFKYTGIWNPVNNIGNANHVINFGSMVKDYIAWVTTNGDATNVTKSHPSIELTKTGTGTYSIAGLSGVKACIGCAYYTAGCILTTQITNNVVTVKVTNSSGTLTDNAFTVFIKGFYSGVSDNSAPTEVFEYTRITSS